MTSREVESELNRRVSQATHDIASKLPRPPKESLIREGLFAMDEPDPQNTGEDEDFDGDDISSTAHGELEQHREMREYARIIAWEMPLLSKLAKPFTPPPLTHPLRFRYTNYMGETHPAASKVVCEFCTRDLSPSPLSETQRVKFTKLLGPHYNLSTDLAKISCESFETQAQNKRYLGDLVDTLITEAQTSEDMFEDVPVDMRHIRVKKRDLIAPFPEAWKLTDERRQYLQRKWGENRRKEIEVGERQLLVDGLAVIEEAAQALPTREERRALMQPTTAVIKGKGKGRTMRAR
ncbi:MAG: hypothetical protein Q9214_007908 [Letrouitia sp. 1 TL-2023]